MISTITSEKIPILSWLERLDPDTLQQAKNLANLPFVHHHIAIMPDAHVGYGMPIGGVAATTGVVIPNAVGVDIGCGVRAVRTTLDRLDQTVLKKILGDIRRFIPLGFKHHKTMQPADAMPRRQSEMERDYPIITREYNSARQQLGTLGGGNHFIEIQQGDDGCIWLMIHSGSRNLGYQVANHYNRLAIEWEKKHPMGIEPKWQLAPLPLDNETGRNYLREMDYCVAFARANRGAMMAVVKEILADFEPVVEFAQELDIAHNYAVREHHFGKDVMVHRKGATRAVKGEMGIIPGSQGSSSYIVRGRGSRDSFCSCSHGAGRKLGRKQAQRHLDFRREVEKLQALGVLHSIRHKRDLDEAAGAYKDIEEVIANQRDLVETITRLTPLAVVKG